jgi:hypothetical protein
MLDHGANTEASEAMPAGRNTVREMYDFQHVIRLAEAGQYEHKTVLDEDEAIPREIPSSYRHNTGEVLRKHLFTKLYDALSHALGAEESLRGMLTYRSLYEAWKHHAVAKRARGDRPLTYASFLYGELFGGHVSATYEQDNAAKRIINTILDAMEKGTLPNLANKIGNDS